MSFLDLFVKKGHFRPSPLARCILGITEKTVPGNGRDDLHMGNNRFAPVIEQWLKSRQENLEGLHPLICVIREFAREGMDLNSTIHPYGSKVTLLDVACGVHGNPERSLSLIKALVKLGADVNQPVDESWLYPDCRALGLPSGAIFCALNSNNGPAVELLLALGAQLAPFDTPEGLACLESISSEPVAMAEVILRHMTGKVARSISQACGESGIPGRPRRL